MHSLFTDREELLRVRLDWQSLCDICSAMWMDDSTRRMGYKLNAFDHYCLGSWNEIDGLPRDNPQMFTLLRANTQTVTLPIYWTSTSIADIRPGTSGNVSPLAISNSTSDTSLCFDTTQETETIAECETSDSWQSV